MTDSLGRDFEILAPHVDLQAAHDLFTRRRVRAGHGRPARKLLTVAAAVLMIGLVAALVVVVRGRSSSPQADSIDAGFEVLAVGEQELRSGHLGVAGSSAQLASMWTELALSATPPPVDFASSVVVAITILDDACPPTLTRLERSADRVITPIFVEPPGDCLKPGILRTFVVGVDRSAVGEEFTLRLPADAQGDGEQLLEVTLTPDGAASRLLSGPPTTEAGPPATALPPASTLVTQAPSTTVEPTTNVETTTTPEPTTTISVPFGEIAPIADATIFYLPDPMPPGWFVAGVINGSYPDDDSNLSGDLEAVPPVEDGTIHEYKAWLMKADGSALAWLTVEEHPAPALASDYPATESVDVGGLRRGHLSQTMNDQVGALPSFQSHDVWWWVQDQRLVSLDVSGAADDAITMVTALGQVSGAQVSSAIADGQRAMLELPLLASARVPGGVLLTARGAADNVLAVCAESTIPTCGSIAELYETPGVAMTMAATPSGPQEVAWLPKLFADPLAPGPRVFDRGQLGSFAYDFGNLATEGIDPGSGLDGFTVIGNGVPRDDLIGLPNIDGDLPP